MVFRNLKHILVLSALCWTSLLHADASLIRHLDARLHFSSQASSAFIQSFEDRDQSYIYDQALAIITYSHEKNLSTSYLFLGCSNHKEQERL